MAYVIVRGPHVPSNTLRIDDRQARLIEIAENLHRAELTQIERADQIAEWIRLTDDSEKVDQLEPLFGGRGVEGGIRRASRELGLDRNEAVRAVKVSALSEDAKIAARETGLDDNQSALIEAASKPIEQQADTFRAIQQAGTVAAYKQQAATSEQVSAKQTTTPPRGDALVRCGLKTLLRRRFKDFSPVCIFTLVSSG